ncbi:MAG: M20/M25/M40 family metallo-hydrolase [Actinobacteria bacterium]|nr:M20/M25/M40 family metallo-hydrolase [Actinomycetota bacterium]
MYIQSNLKLLINRERLIERFLEILSIKSPSKNEKQIIEYINGHLKSLGINTEIDDSGKNFGSNSGNLTGFLPGKSKEILPIFLGAHVDTVFVNGEIIPAVKDGIVTNQDKNTILGGDDKVAVAAILEALDVIKENNIATGDIDLIFTIAEEIAVLGARYLDLGKIKSVYGFFFDGEGDIGTIFNEAPYHNNFEITITGKAAHSGIEPEKGINSIKTAADAIAELKPGRVDSQTTYNIGIINGGTAMNIVPENTKIIAEARSLKLEKLESITEFIRKTFEKNAKKSGARADIKIDREYDGFKIKEDEISMQIAMQALRKMGIEPRVVSTGGGSDINIFNAKGKRALNLSSGMENVHTNEEYVKVEQLFNLAELILNICSVRI